MGQRGETGASKFPIGHRYRYSLRSDPNAGFLRQTAMSYCEFDSYPPEGHLQVRGFATNPTGLQVQVRVLLPRAGPAWCLHPGPLVGDPTPQKVNRRCEHPTSRACFEAKPTARITKRCQLRGLRSEARHYSLLNYHFLAYCIYWRIGPYLSTGVTSAVHT